MGNNTKTVQISAGDIAKALTGTGGIFTKTTDTTQAEAERAVKDTAAAAQQEAALQTAVTEAQTIATLTERPYTRTKAEKVFDQTKANLEKYRTAANGSSAKVTAMVDILKAVERFPSKSLLDEIYNFFLKYKDESFLSPMNSLQNITNLDITTNLKLKLLYDIMMRLAKREANKNTMSLEMIRSVFRKNDNFVNWISAKMRQLNPPGAR